MASANVGGYGRIWTWPAWPSLPELPIRFDVVGVLPSGIFDLKVSRTRFCADRCVLLVRRQEYPGRGPRGARGWPPPGQHGQAVPPSSYKTRAKIMYEQKTRGVL